MCYFDIFFAVWLIFPAIRLYLGTLGTLGDDPLPDIDEEPSCKCQRQLGKIFNWHIIYGKLFYVLHQRLSL